MQPCSMKQFSRLWTLYSLASVSIYLLNFLLIFRQLVKQNLLAGLGHISLLNFLLIQTVG